MKRTIRFLGNGLAALAITTLVFAGGCSKKEEDAAATDATTPSAVATVATSAGGATSSTTTSALSAAYPSGLALAVFPQATTASISLGRLSGNSDDKLAVTITSAEKDQTVAAKGKEGDKLVNGTADTCMPSSLSNTERAASTETCYEFDQDMNYGGTAVSSLGTKTGLNSKNEACMVAFARAQMDSIVQTVDQTLGYVQSMMCQAKKSGLDVNLAANATLDLTTSIKTALGAKATTVTSAIITRLTDIDSRPVYRSDVKLTDASSRTREIHLVHSPASQTTNATYNGTLWMQMSGDV